MGQVLPHAAATAVLHAARLGLAQACHHCTRGGSICNTHSRCHPPGVHQVCVAGQGHRLFNACGGIVGLAAICHLSGQLHRTLGAGVEERDGWETVREGREGVGGNGPAAWRSSIGMAHACGSSQVLCKPG